jgi:hypothetical protein
MSRRVTATKSFWRRIPIQHTTADRRYSEIITALERGRISITQKIVLVFYIRCASYVKRKAPSAVRPQATVATTRSLILRGLPRAATCTYTKSNKSIANRWRKISRNDSRRGYQPGLPGRRTLLSAEPQRATRPDEIIVALQQRHLIVQMLGIASMARGRAEGPTTPGAAVTATPTLRGPTKAMVDDVALAGPTVEGAIAIRTAAVFDGTNPHETCSSL